MVDNGDALLIERRRELRQAVQDLRYRKLSEAFRWASTQLRGMRKPREEECPVTCSVSPEMEGNVEFADIYDLAVSYFENKEFNSAMYVLEEHVKSGKSTPEIDFMYYYTFFLNTQRFKAHKKANLGMLPGHAMLIESDLSRIRSELESRSKPLDPFLQYVLGLVLIEQSQMEHARQILIQSVTEYPCNWSAWKALMLACTDYGVMRSLSLPEHFMSDFFRAHVYVDLQHCEEALDIAESLSKDFCHSKATMSTIAMALNHLRNYDEAQEMFADMLTHWPDMIEYMDVYSNILYVKEENVSLTVLARRLADEDPYRPETCCVIGNYYSFRGQHDKAVMYFQRALKLDPNFLAAWTLMGHEFVELKNPPAAIEAYRKAVAINPSDYRAWYGLGQTYELVNMPYYALYYYSKAVLLRPKDARMWNAMGHCYSSPAVAQLESAIRCYKRSLPFDKELVSLRQLAHHHNLLAEKDSKHYEEAAYYYQMILDQSESQGEASREDAAEALSFLAEYHKKAGDLEVSQDYYSRLLDFGLPQHREVAKLSLREIQDIIVGGTGTSPMQSPGMVSTPGSAPR